MSRVLSFSTDKKFAAQLDSLIELSGYKNRSMFLRDASVHFFEATQRGDIVTMDDNVEVDGTMVIYYQHGIENKLIDLRHSHALKISSYHHNCLTNSHTCVDTMQITGLAKSIRSVLEKLKNTRDIDRVSFIAAPMREEGCC
ncbi:MAG: hypothetical protein QF440_00300 [Candidatus Thalassarchaeaceae archaeon]|jgi:metal-responsive CopG/Arc/MetJ family transcriptional regulator|nr:hypothetical protein [Candidatus Thalassarchaeaceae archaeon]